MVIVWLAPSLALLAGLVLACLGWRGRRIDDHPLCRKCGFDLFGLPADSTRCSECGAEVGRKNAIRVGHRRKRLGLICAGAGLLLPSLLWMGMVGWIVARKIDINEYKPVWWLVSDAKGTSLPKRNASLAELNKRLKAGRLSDDDVSMLVTLALDMQGDMSKAWAPAWGDAVEWLHAAGKLPAEKWQRYVRQAWTLTVETRARVRRGAPLPLRLRSQARLGSAGRLWIECGTRVEISGEESDRRSAGMRYYESLSNGGVGQTGWRIPADDEALASLGEGPQDLRVQADLSIFDAQPPGWNPNSVVKPVVRRNLDLRAGFEIVPGETVNIVKDPSLRESIKSALRVRLRRDAAQNVIADVRAQSPPVSLAFDVFVREGEKEWRLGSVAFVAGKSGWWTATNEAEAFSASKYDVVLRPSKAMAEGQVDVVEMWDKEVIIENVAVAGSGQPR